MYTELQARLSSRRGLELLPIIMFLVLQILLLLSSFGVKPSAAEKHPFRVAKANCNDTCGNVPIPFPFGIGTGCFLDEWYEVVCLREKNTSVPRLKKIGLEVLDISLPHPHNNRYSDAASDGWINVSFPITYSNRNCTDSVGAEHPSVPTRLSGSNFIFSQDLNVFTAVGCGVIAFMNSTDSAIVGCKSECKEGIIVTQLNDCSGHGCCQSTIPSNLQAFDISFKRVDAATVSGDGCSYAFLAHQSWSSYSYTDVYRLKNVGYAPVLLGWGIANDTSFWRSLREGADTSKSYDCDISGLSPRNYGDVLPYTQCYCKYGYEGNAYLGGGGCQAAAEQHPFRKAMANCTKKCGNVPIPFPFGIDTGCFLDEWYEVVCLEEKNTSVPRLKKTGLELLNISLPYRHYNNGYRDAADGWINVSFPITYSNPNCIGSVGAEHPSVPPSLLGSNFIFSQDLNKFTAVGCGVIAFMNSTDSAIVGCKSECREESNTTWCNDCSGHGCCQNTIPSYLQAFNISFQREDAVTVSGDECSYAFLSDRSWSSYCYTDVHRLKNVGHASVLLGWGIGSETSIGSSWREGADTSKSYDCDSSSLSPRNYGDELPYMQCYCEDGYEGNAYLGGEGCQDIDECQDPTLNSCTGKCVNTMGSYNCEDGSKAVKLAMMVIGGFIGAILFLLSARWLCKTIKRRKKMKLRQKFFKQNGGLLLQQQLASPRGNVEKSKLFSSKQLERATDNFNGNRILGQGGQGTVYKGMLVDGRIVAIKKSKVPDEGNVEQFINEVSILSQINHRNVVKLLGCCLETKVPLLVYEFVPNGTLYQYLHDPNEEVPIPWDIHLQIAYEVAGALFYLHSAASIPIYHRDIKTTNILLDEKYRAKVADFGTSRLVALDQTHVTTLVQGTFGYLDPEYFQSCQFTDKSDVYSFGVVLAELLTGQKPISSLRAEEGRSLATYFILSMEDDCLFDIVDGRVLNEENKGEIIAVAHLAKRCLNLNGRTRPTMKEVARELESIRQSSHPSTMQELKNKERYESFEIDVTKTQDATFKSMGSKTREGTSLSTDVYPLLASTDTW